MSRRTLLLLSLVVWASVFSSACQPAPPPFECTDAIGCVDIPPGEALKLGVIQDFSGGAAVAGAEQSQIIELALDRRDDQLLGHPIELQSEDERCLAEGGTIAALKVVADPQVVAILGTTCSGTAMTAARAMSEAGLVMVSGANAAPSLTAIGGERGADWQPGYFRTSLNGLEQAQAAAVFAFQELGLTQAATINDGDSFTQGFTSVF
ncbi:MAG: ABC transporter substrate-binding protein, partial [Anaerolineae bacterium]